MKPIRILVVKKRLASIFLLTALWTIPPGWTRHPPLYHLDPPGGQLGTVVKVTLSGERLSDFEEVLFHDDGIAMVGHRVLDDEHVLCHFRIDDEARLGTHPLRVRTRSGITHLVLFSVGNLEEISEVEPNDRPEYAQFIRKGLTVNGKAGLEDVDQYCVALEEGERLSVEIEGIRLGENHWDRNFCLFDPKMELYGPDGSLIRSDDDTQPLTQDPAFIFHATREGNYMIAVFDSAFAGFGDDRYRLHVGEFPRPTTLSPLGASPGDEVQLEWIGDPDLRTQSLTIPITAPFGVMTVMAQRGAELCPTGFPFRIMPYPTRPETEPNGDAEPQRLEKLPVAVEGKIDPAGDVDVFIFEGKRGQSLEFHVYARNQSLYESRFGSSLDSRLAVLGPGNEALVWEDDTIGLDSVGECTLPTDGIYKVFVYDHRRMGGPDFPYRLEIQAAEPALELKLEVDFLGYQPVAMPVYRGNRTAVVVRAKRKRFSGEVTVELPNLPPGVTAEIPNLPEGEVLFPVLLKADADAPLSGALVEFDAVSDTGSQRIRGGLRQNIMLAFGRDYNPYLYQTVSRMGLAVVEEAPYRVEALTPEIEIAPGGSAKARLRVIREPGFADPIQFSAPWNPPGVASGKPTLPKNETEIAIELSASPDAAPGVRKMLFTGDYEDYSVATPFFDIRILEPERETSTVGEFQPHMEQPFMSQSFPESTPEEVGQPKPARPVVDPASETALTETYLVSTEPLTVSFRHDIVPLLNKFGCSAAACHGRKEEGNPFYLSLFGTDADSDYHSLMGDPARPLTIPGLPEKSLLLLKSSGQETHEGGEIFLPGTEPYRLMKTWIEEGARKDPVGAPRIENLEIRPSYAVLNGKGATRRFSLHAAFSDGTQKEVTQLGTLNVSNPTRLSLDSSGLATVNDSGEAAVLGRYGKLSACAQVVCRPGYRPVEEVETPVSNYIDERVFDKLRLLRIAPAALCEDHEFLRRAHLDIIGLLPTVEETIDFLEDRDPGKRSRLVDRLLARPEFADVWATKWSDYFHVRSEDALDRKAMLRYSDWIRDSISSGATPARLVTEILTAEGGAFDTPATNFYKPFTPHEQFAEDTAQVFLGVRLQCAKCHDHPFDRWTMEDYYSFAAFFGRTFRKNSEDRRQALVYSDNSYGEIKHPDTDEVMAPRFLAGRYPDTEGLDRRAVLADWIVSGTNPWFARNVANRVWEHFLGTGLVSPVDDFRDSNPPTHPKLLNDLAQRLVESEYKIKPLIRDIVLSSVYQLSCEPCDPGNQDAGNYSHFPIRRLPAETLADALASVSQQPVKFPYYPLGYRAMEHPNGFSESHFLTVFGRPGRVTVCAEERQRQPTLSQGLALMNGGIVQQACTSSKGRLKRLLNSEGDDSAIVSEIYLAAFCRPPSPSESRLHQDYIADADNREKALEDIVWALLNSKEFLFQH